MRIDWDVPIRMDDGLVLRCDVYRPIEDGKYPVILTYGPYAKWLHFEQIYKTCWDKMCAEHPEVPAGSTNRYQNWEVVDPEKWVPDGYACVRVDSRGCGRSPGYVELWGPRETQDFAQCIEWAGVQPWSSGKVGLERHLVLRDECVPGRGTAAQTPRRDLRVGRRERLVSRGEPPRRHLVHLPRQLVRHAGEDRAARRGNARLQEPHDRGLGHRPGDALRRRAARQPLRLRASRARARVRRRVLEEPHARLVEDQGTASVQRQLGRPGTAPARQHRGLPQRRQQGEVARDARRRALDALLHRLRRRDAEEVLRLLPEGREERLGSAAESAAPDPPSRRALRRARRERMAACAHALDQAVPRRTGRHSFRPGSEGAARV